jgi:hypothetical protein
MPSPVERLELRKQLSECRVCAWLQSLDEKDRKEWAIAIANPRYSPGSIAAEIQVDQTAAEYGGVSIGESSIDTHRRKGHR